MPIIGSPVPVVSNPEVLTFDPTSEDPANSPLIVNSGLYGLLAQRYPTPPLAAQWASSVSTEGAALSSIRHENRQIDLTIDVEGVNALQALEAKFAKLYREGGTLQRIYPDGRTIVFDVLTADGWDPAFDYQFYAGVTTVSVSLTCKPYGRSPAQTLTLHTETALPVNVFTEPTIQGDMPGEGRLVITDAQGQDQWWATWGVQSRNYSSATTAALHYEAESLTLMGGSTLVTGTAPVSGAGTNNIVQATLTGSDQAILSTQATGGGAHLSHVGSFHVYARVRVTLGSAGDITLALQWAPGDFTVPTTNTATTLDSTKRGATYFLVDLGCVTIPVVENGVQRWEGRVIARSTNAGDLFHIDDLFLIPTDEGSGVVSGVARSFTPTSFSARDEFDQTAGTLAGKTLPVGGTWAGAGSATGFTVDATNHRITRTVDDVAFTSGRFAIAGTTTFTDVAVGVDVTIDTSAGAIGEVHSAVFARYIDTSNFFRAAYDLIDNGFGGYDGRAIVSKLVAGVTTTVRSIDPIALTTTPQLRLVAYANGLWQFYVDGSLITSGYDTDLATGGTLASGKVGIYDGHAIGALTPLRAYDNFWAAVPSTDAAIRASQSLEIRHDGVIREDPTGTIWSRPGSYEGDYLRVPVSGAEGRTARFIVKASRLDPFAAGDLAIDDLSAQLIYVPRYLVVPT